MNYELVKKQKEAVNEHLERMNAPFRLAFMTQNKASRITIEIGTPEQISKGTAQNNLLYYATRNEASKFLTGFSAALMSLHTYSLPVNK